MILDISNEELVQRIPLAEDSLLEFKEVFFRGDSDRVSDPSADDLADEIAALANSRDGGILLLGVQNRTRQIVGIPIDKLAVVEQWLSGIINDRIKGPPRVATIHFEALDASRQRCALVRINVPSSLEVHASPGGYFERRGDSKRPIPPDALARLLQQRSQVGLIRFEEQIIHAATFAELDPALCQRFLADGQGSAEVQLLRMHLLREHAGVLRPTVLGALVCAREPRTWVRGAWAQVVSYSGQKNDPADQLDARDFAGPIDEQIVETLAFVERNMKIGARKAPGRKDIPQYLPRVVFEAVVNAVAHRDYSITGMPVRVFMFADRIEITSPGALPNTMTIEGMRTLSLPRNELLSSLFARYFPIPQRRRRTLGRQTLMDKRGAGVEIIEGLTRAHSGQDVRYEHIERLALRLVIPAADPLTAPGGA